MFDPTGYNELTVTESSIPGLFVIKLPVHGDNRGWFKENYQKEKMEAFQRLERLRLSAEGVLDYEKERANATEEKYKDFS